MTLGAVTDGAVVSATTVKLVAPDVSAQPFVAVTFWAPPGAVAAALKVYTPVYGELLSARRRSNRRRSRWGR